MKARWWVAVCCAAIVGSVACAGSEGDGRASPTDPQQSEVIGMRTRPLAVADGSTPDGPSFNASWGTIPGEEYWSGLTSVTVHGASPVTITAAHPIAGPHLDLSGVFVAERGKNGMHGATSKNFPGFGEVHGGAPIPAVGAILTPGPEWVIYVVGALDSSSSDSYLLGASLRLRLKDGTTRRIRMMSPTLLCRDWPSESDEEGDDFPGEPQRCRSTHREFIKAVRNEFGAEIW